MNRRKRPLGIIEQLQDRLDPLQPKLHAKHGAGLQDLASAIHRD
jgi:hypothetical protein